MPADNFDLPFNSTVRLQNLCNYYIYHKWDLPTLKNPM